MSDGAYLQFDHVPRKFNNPGELQSCLGGAEGYLDAAKDPWIRNKNESIPMDDLIQGISNFAQNRWMLTSKQVDISLESIDKLRGYIQTIEKPTTLISKICSCFYKQTGRRNLLIAYENMLAQMQRIYDYVDTYKDDLAQQVKQKRQSIYIPPRKSGLIRAIHYNSGGKAIVHLNRTKLGDEAIKRVKTVTHAIELGTANVFISATGITPRESECLKAFRGIPGFVQLIDDFSYTKEDDDGEYTKRRGLFEHCNRGTLEEARFLSLEEIKIIFTVLIKNVALMHRMGYLHRDLKSSNILLHKEDNGPLLPVISDFGGMCKVDDEKARAGHQTTYTFASPEYAEAQLSRTSEKYQKIVAATTPALDGWGLGCIHFDLLNMGKLDWLAIRDEEEAFKEIAKIKGQWLPEPPRKTSPQYLVWEILQNRLPISEAENRVDGLKW